MNQQDYKELLELIDYWYKAKNKSGGTTSSNLLPSKGSYTIMRDEDNKIKIITNPDVKKVNSTKQLDTDLSKPGAVEKLLDSIRKTIQQSINEYVPKAGMDIFKSLMYSNPLTYLLYQNFDIFTKGLSLGARTLDIGGKLLGGTFKGIGSLFGTDKEKESSRTYRLTRRIGQNKTQENTNGQQLASTPMPLLPQNTNSGTGAMNITNAIINGSPNYIIAQNVMVMGASQILQNSKAINQPLLPGSNIPLLPGPTQDSSEYLPASSVPLLPGPTLQDRKKLEDNIDIQEKSSTALRTTTQNTSKILEQSKLTNSLLSKQLGKFVLLTLGGVAIYLMLKDKLPQIINTVKNGIQGIKNTVDNIKNWVSGIFSDRKNAEKPTTQLEQPTQSSPSTNNINEAQSTTDVTDQPATPSTNSGQITQEQIDKVQRRMGINSTGTTFTDGRYLNSSHGRYFRPRSDDLPSPIFALADGVIQQPQTETDGTYTLVLVVMDTFKKLLTPGRDSIIYRGISTLQPDIVRGKKVRKWQLLGYAKGMFSVERSGAPQSIDQFSEFTDLGIQKMLQEQQSGDTNSGVVDTSSMSRRELSDAGINKWGLTTYDMNNQFSNTRSVSSTPPKIGMDTITKAQGSIYQTSNDIKDSNKNLENKVVTTQNIVTTPVKNQSDIKITQDFGAIPSQIAAMASGVNITC